MGGAGRVAGFDVADRAHLYLWVTNAFMAEGHTVAKAWGFVPRTILTWVKPRIGMGHYFRNTTEHVIFGVRGSLPTKRKNARTDFTAPMGRHSEKPEMFYRLIESMSPGPYLELFARRAAPGWDTWGNETPRPVAAVARDGDLFDSSTRV
jgi:N6-adenosine-specific RNA methylase IME4